MRSAASMMLALVLAGCGARNALEVGGAAPAPANAHMTPTCAPNDGPALQLAVGTPPCQGGTVSTPVITFLISGADLAGLSPGSTLTVSPDINGGTQGDFFSPIDWMLTGGTLDFTTLVPGVSATGSYDVTWDYGAASGTFTADECPSNGPCGG